MAALPRDGTMVATAKEGVAFLQKEGADDLIKLQGLDGAKKDGDEAAPSSQTAEKAPMETDAPALGLPQNRTMVETAKEAEQVLAGEILAETRASTEQLKTAVATSSPPQKSRTMVETAKIGQELLGAEADLIGETRQQTAEVKKQAEAEATKEPEKEPAAAETTEEKKSPAAKKSPPKKSPAKEKPSPKKDGKAKKEPKPSPAKEPEKEAAKTSPAKKDAEDKTAKTASPRKRGGRSSFVDQLLQEAQKFAGNTAGDVSEGRTTRRSSKGAEPITASPAKRPRQAKEKSKPVEADDTDSNDEADK